MKNIFTKLGIYACICVFSIVSLATVRYTNKDHKCDTMLNQISLCSIDIENAKSNNDKVEIVRDYHQTLYSSSPVVNYNKLSYTDMSNDISIPTNPPTKDDIEKELVKNAKDKVAVLNKSSKKKSKKKNTNIEDIVEPTVIPAIATEEDLILAQQQLLLANLTCISEPQNTYTGKKLSASRGVNYGPNGKETWYDLNMSGVVRHMRNLGNTDEYWIREDGCKMLGDYIIIAANLETHPRGSLVETSLGTGIVCDTGGFAKTNKNQIDIATNWSH